MAQGIGRVNLPAEFYDRVSAKVALPPLPEFTYARMLYMASMGAALNRIGPDAARGVFTGVMADGGIPSPDWEMGQLILNGQLAMADAIMVCDDLVAGPGHTVRIPRPVYSGGGYTFAARRVAPGQTISTTPITVTDEEVSITVERHNGPYATSGSSVQPYLVTEAEAKRSVHSIVKRVGDALQYDRNALVDGAISALFDNWSGVIYPGDPNNTLASVGTSGDAAACPVPGARPFSLEALLRGEAWLKTRNIRRFADGTYKCIITPAQALQLSVDPLWVRSSPFKDDKNPLSMTNLGRVGNVDVYTSNSNTIDTSTVSGVSINHAVMFGPNSVGYAETADPCHVRQSSQTNYDSQALLIWIKDEGASQLDNRFGVSIHSC